MNLTPTPLEIIESCDMLRILEHGDKVHMLEVQTKSIGVDVEGDISIAEKIMQHDQIFNDQIKPLI